jgi:putative colanic acid biosynthesis acetyltransferase WcaF
MQIIFTFIPLMIFSHDPNAEDAYKRPAFTVSDKIRRLVWMFTWFLFCRFTPTPMHTWRSMVLRLFGAKIGASNYIYPNCTIWAPWLLETEEVVTIGGGVEIYNPGGVKLGHHTILSQDAFLCGATHNYQSIDFTYIKKQIITEAYVWICARAVVLPGVHCREGSVLGAASVTGKNMDAWTVYAGNPAVAVKKRNNLTSAEHAGIA